MSSAGSVKSPESPCPMENAPWAVTRIPCTTASAFTMSTMPGRPRSSSAFSPAVEKTLSGFSASTGRLTSSPFTFSRSGTTCPSISSFQFRAPSASCSRATGRRASGGTPGSSSSTFFKVTTARGHREIFSVSMWTGMPFSIRACSTRCTTKEGAPQMET